MSYACVRIAFITLTVCAELFNYIIYLPVSLYHSRRAVVRVEFIISINVV
jgi:hypothetical protein